jgi:hypothetical protein
MLARVMAPAEQGDFKITDRSHVITMRNHAARVVRRGQALLLLSELTSHHISEVQEDGLPFSGMMVVTTQTSTRREGHPGVILAFCLRPVKS